jgi:hypothetical protein
MMRMKKEEVTWCKERRKVSRVVVEVDENQVRWCEMWHFEEKCEVLVRDMRNG